MKRYVALLRGVNISGKNKIAMADLKEGVASLGCVEVQTWLNSGNVVFSSVCADITALTAQIEQMLHDRFSLDVPVFVAPQEALVDALQHAPDWWGADGKVWYDNLIFLIPPFPTRSFATESAVRTRSMRKPFPTTTLCSGRSIGRSIKKRTGGQELPMQRCATRSQSAPPIRCESSQHSE